MEDGNMGGKRLGWAGAGRMGYSLARRLLDANGPRREERQRQRDLLDARKRTESFEERIVGLPDFGGAEPQHSVGKLDLDQMTAVEPQWHRCDIADGLPKQGCTRDENDGERGLCADHQQA